MSWPDAAKKVCVVGADARAAGLGVATSVATTRFAQRSAERGSIISGMASSPGEVDWILSRLRVRSVGACC